MKILIDTNIFLDFYRSEVHPLMYFKVLIRHSKHLILTDQIEKEFSRNREQVLRPIIKKFIQESKLDKISTSLISSLAGYEDLIDQQKLYEKNRQNLINEMTIYLNDPEKDPVASYFNELVQKVKKQNNFFVSSQRILKKAHQRKLIGDPPSSGNYSIGDEINWEIILENIDTDLVLVGRDSTYTKNINHLKKEYHSRTGFFINHGDCFLKCVKVGKKNNFF